MLEDDPADSYLVGGAGLPVGMAPPEFQYETARGFQADALEWIHSGERPVGLLAAPTGGGKTAIIAELATASRRTLCLYPTNALATAQVEVLEEEFGLDVDVLTGRTLEERGYERSQELLSYASDPARGDVVLTNPDVLQAILDGMYISPGSELLRFFAQFDAVVYDEFHYYDPLAASGLLMQIKVLSERGKYRGRDGTVEFPRVLLPSATPSSAFVEHVEDDLDLDVQRITASVSPLDLADSDPSVDESMAYTADGTPTGHLRAPAAVEPPVGEEGPFPLSDLVAEVPEELNRFRYPMLVNRWSNDVEDAFPTIANALKRAVGLHEGGSRTGKAAVIFNSAARSNRFQDFLLDDDDLADVSVKDNGYDTGSGGSLPEDFAVLNTTSKGEVGLDFDLERLVMVSPFTASDFVQRIGRAARHSPAIVDVFGLDDPLWPDVQSYPAFLGRIVATIDDRTMDRDRLRDLAGLRAASALQGRFEDDQRHVEDIREDFGDFDRVGRWRSFLQSVGDATALLDDDSGPFDPTLDRATATVARSLAATLDGLRSLRGQSLTHSIRYPLGDRREGTEYDLLTALRHYPIEGVRGGTIELSRGAPGRRIGHFPGAPSEGQGIDLGRSRNAVTRQLRDAIGTHVDAATWNHTDLDATSVRRFLQVVDLGSAMVPDLVEASEYEIETDGTGAVTDIRRQAN